MYGEIIQHYLESKTLFYILNGVYNQEDLSRNLFPTRFRFFNGKMRKISNSDLALYFL